MRESYIIYHKDPEKKIATITFNRPEKLNAATTADWEEVKQKVIEAEQDEEVKVLIFKGAGRCFGSGHDVNNLGPHHGWGGPGDPRPSIRRRLSWDKHVFWGKRGLTQTILTCDKATIAQVHGYCYGGHHQLAIACDLVIASEDALFTHPGYRYIGPLGEITLYFLTMGVRKAKEMMLTGIPLTAQEAFQCGLINRVVPADKLEEEVNRIAETIALQPFDAIVMGKAFFEAALDVLGAGAGYTVGYIGHTLQTNIHYEPGEFNLFRSRREKGLKGALKEREARFRDAPLAR
jgi:enoyl-CoA hydratase